MAKSNQIVEQASEMLTQPNRFATMRGDTHGDYEAMSETAQALKDTIHDAQGVHKLPPHARESLDLIATKIARIVCGKWDERDHWDDIGGYAKLVSDRIIKVPAKQEGDK